jgi:hypothetical protein
MQFNSAKIIILVLLQSIFCYCGKDKTIPSLIIGQDNLYIESKAGGVLIFEVNCTGSDLQRFSITARPENDIQTTIFDTIVSGGIYKLTYNYRVPAISKASNILLEFIIVDKNGSQAKALRKIIVTSSPTQPSETTGHQIFSAVSGLRSGFDLIALQAVFPNQVSPGQVTIKDVSVLDTLGNYSLSRKWISSASYKFIKFNGFDYANASYESIKQSYDAGVADYSIDNVSSGDIILTRIPSAPSDSGYMAIKIVYVIDQDSTNADSYIFNVKK